jgi:OOP family OmpA-OmpF porin
MKQKLIIILVLLINFTYKAQQNLVPNGSFELYDSCAQTVSQFYNYVKYWYSPSNSATPDYFNSCNSYTDQVSVPQNYFGYKIPQNGNGYAGQVFWYNQNMPNNNYREYISIKLKETLKANKIYCISLYISVADSMVYAIDKIGLLFTSDSNKYSLSSVIPKVPQVIFENANCFNNKIDWMLLEKEYISNGTESFLTFGNFNSDQNTNLCSLKSVNKYNLEFNSSYYFVDNISIIECGESNFNSEVSSANVFTPNGDGYNDVFTVNTSIYKSYKLTIFNRWGNKMFESINRNNWDGKYGSNLSPTGTYFFLLEGENINGEYIQNRGYVELIK